jgi:hypothetical protein
MSQKEPNKEKGKGQVADPEVRPRPRRRFSAAEKLRLLEEADRCREPGEVGALLRREGRSGENNAGRENSPDCKAKNGVGKLSLRRQNWRSCGGRMSGSKSNWNERSSLSRLKKNFVSSSIYH